MQFQNVVMYY